MDTELKNRRYDLDWLRIIAILLLHLFHSAMPFVAEWEWHIKNGQTSNLILECNYFLSRWRMPLLFFISGVGTVFVLNTLSVREYVMQRAKRLLIPLVFGMLVIVPPQVYMERIFKGAAYSSYFDFYPTIFTTGAYPIGNLSWHHLWFIAYLFVYSIIAIPLFVLLKSGKGQRFVKSAAVFSNRYGMWAFGLVLCLAAGLYFRYPNETHAFVDDGAGFTKYFLYFVFGYFIGVNSVFWRRIEEHRRQNLRLAFVSLLLVNYFRWNNIEPEWGLTLANLLYFAVIVLSGWIWIIAVLGYAKHYLNFNNRFLQLANEAIYPFYILHQTVIVIIGYYIIQVEEAVISKYLFLTFVSFIISVGIYWLFVRPYKIPRILFGMKAKGI